MADTNTKEEIVDESTEAEEAAEVIDESKKIKKEKPEEKKPGFFARMKDKLKKFWKNYKSELKKITWYSRKQTFYSTRLVLACIIISAVFIGVLDFGFSMGLEGLGKLVELFR